MPPQLLLLTHEFSPRIGGAATYAREMAIAASGRGWKVIVVAPHYASTSDADFPFEVVRIPIRGNQNWPDRLSMRKAVSRLDLNWKETTLYLPEAGPLRLWIYARELNLPKPQKLVVTLHGSEILNFARWPHRQKRFQHLLGVCDKVGVVSGGINRLLDEHFKVPSNRLAVVPGALSQNFAPISRKNYKREQVRILVVGRIHPRKGQLNVIRAIAALPQNLKNRIELQLVGPVRRHGYTREIVKVAQRHQIALLGPTEESDEALSEIYASADIFVMASEPTASSVEGFGIVYLEAAASGLPVIGFDTGGVSDAIGSDNGILIAPNRQDLLTSAIGKLVESPQLRSKLGKAGPRWASLFSWERNVRKLFEDSI